MPHIVVDDEQAKLIAATEDSIEIRDKRGHHLGYVAHGFTDEDFAIAKRRMMSDEPRYSTKQVMDRLHSMDPK